jgi:hypothetical protein
VAIVKGYTDIIQQKRKPVQRADDVRVRIRRDTSREILEITTNTAAIEK